MAARLLDAVWGVARKLHQAAPMELLARSETNNFQELSGSSLPRPSTLCANSVGWLKQDPIGKLRVCVILMVSLELILTLE